MRQEGKGLGLLHTLTPASTFQSSFSMDIVALISSSLRRLYCWNAVNASQNLLFKVWDECSAKIACTRKHKRAWRASRVCLRCTWVILYRSLLTYTDTPTNARIITGVKSCYLCVVLRLLAMCWIEPLFFKTPKQYSRSQVLKVRSLRCLVIIKSL